ncbi:DNA polymerase IV [Methylobacter sp. YRD-M1]|uniref:DNA polymerase IV n=1 Tax=Methylobacter sp. YRD-M1 TaxID=2911520 RepID=UPI00227B81DF|nr:DNA polymerase IV [Methylobacter sp. YRD-M1]WAK01939.1 DNA polymerase IV [Methylobacter sp. YRD-M1]
MDRIRKIIHIDMDAFFAAIEQRDFPAYRNKPLIVGGAPDSRGVVATCSYEARQYGIHSAMPSSQAYRLCPQAIFVKPRFEAYREASQIIRKIFAGYTELVEPLSLDEAYLDVSDVQLHQGSATLIAKAIKAAIKHETGLTASAGISYNKFLAKIASDMDKPDGLYLIMPEQGARFVEQLTIDKFHGIGKATAQKMQALGIRTGKDLRNLSLAILQQHFGKSARHYYNICRGIDNRPVNSQRLSKSVGVETTFQRDITARQEIIAQLHGLLEKALVKAAEKQLAAYTLTVKIKYHDFVQVTRSRTLPHAVTTTSRTLAILEDLLRSTDIGARRVRLLGVTLSSLESRSRLTHFQQTDLFN